MIIDLKKILENGKNLNNIIYKKQKSEIEIQGLFYQNNIEIFIRFLVINFHKYKNILDILIKKII
jgi:hypothetical protein